MKCNHEWQGRKDSVVCLKCGKALTPAEYAATLKKKQRKDKQK